MWDTGRYRPGAVLYNIRMPVLVTCARCGETVKRKPSTVSKTNYCSQTCHYHPVPSEAELRRLYENATISDVARHLNAERSVVADWLDKRGIRRKTRSEARQVFMNRLSYEDRLGMTAASRAKMAETGKKPYAGLVRRARGVEQKARLSIPERQVLNWAIDRGYEVVAQKAIDKFNVDVAIPELKVAIEVDGGLWHTRHSPGKLEGDRVKREFLESLGWKVFRIRGRSPGTMARDLKSLQKFLGDQFNTRR